VPTGAGRACRSPATTSARAPAGTITPRCLTSDIIVVRRRNGAAAHSSSQERDRLDHQQRSRRKALTSLRKVAGRKVLARVLDRPLVMNETKPHGRRARTKHDPKANSIRPKKR
jgi:hypothetical protein